MKKPTIGPMFPYYGGKWRSSGYYPPPRYNIIVELFSGAGGYAMMWQRKTILFDASPHIAAVWQYLLVAPIEDLRALPSVVRSVNEVPEAARALVGFWLNPGSAQPKKTASSRANPSAQTYSAGSVWSEKTRNRLLEEVPRIRAMGWTFTQTDWRRALIPAEPCTIFIDPPYKGAGKHYTIKWTDNDYAELSAKCLDMARAGHQVIVCENVGATWMPFVPLHRYHGSVKDSEEAIWHSHG
jgi:site-specific DNA-adenine methylase